MQNIDEFAEVRSKRGRMTRLDEPFLVARQSNPSFISPFLQAGGGDHTGKVLFNLIEARGCPFEVPHRSQQHLLLYRPGAGERAAEHTGPLLNCLCASCCLDTQLKTTYTQHQPNLPQLYEPFYADFGPLNLGRTYRFCEITARMIKVGAAALGGARQTHKPFELQSK